MNNLENLTIHRFRGLRDLSLESLGQINLLVGVNNSGKTSVLEAISTYCRPLDPFEWLNTAWRREIKLSRKPQIDALKWLFPQNSEARQFDLYQGETHVCGDGCFILRESQAIYQEFEGSDFNSEDSDLKPDSLVEEEVSISDFTDANKLLGASIQLNATLSETLEQDISNEDLSVSFNIWEDRRLVKRGKSSKIVLPVETVTPFSHRIEQVEVKLLSEVIFKGLKPEVIKLLQVMDKAIEDLEILSPRGSPRLYITHKRTGISPLSAFGDGVRRLLYIALNLVKVKGGVLLIDELETAIHTEALKPAFSWLVQWCQEMDVQLFATTHSLETVDELLDASESVDFAFYRLYPPDSKIKVIRHDRERLKRLREDLGQEVRW